MRFYRYILAAMAMLLLLAGALWTLPVQQGEASASEEEPAAVDLPQDVPELSAASAILIEASTGRVIYEKDADDRRAPASMTKMMTCLLAQQALSAKKEVVISPRAAMTEDIPLGFSVQDVFTAEELTRGMMLESDNGAAVALAEAVDGSVPAFVARMNRKAAEIGMSNTHFANPNGLTQEGHYSTARDMAQLARYAMKQKDFRAVVGLKTAPVRWLLPQGKIIMAENTNKLLGSYAGVTGIKTGWTQAAGGCLAASAKRSGMELIAVVMKTPTPQDRFTDAKKLLDYGFSHAKLLRGKRQDEAQRTLWVKNGTRARVKVHAAEDVNYVLLSGEDPRQFRIRYEVPPVVKAPLKEGQTVGRAVLTYKGQTIGAMDMVADRVDEGRSFGSMLVGLFEGVLKHF